MSQAHVSGHASHSLRGATEHPVGSVEHPSSAAEHARGAGEHLRGAAEHARGAAEHARGAAEHARGAAEHARGAPEHARGVAEHARGVAEHLGRRAGHPAGWMAQYPTPVFDHQTSVADWIHLIRSEYLEVPGLHLTKSQVQRLWGIDSVTCDALLGALVDVRFLRQTRTGAYVRADSSVG